MKYSTTILKLNCLRAIPRTITKLYITSTNIHISALYTKKIKTQVIPKLDLPTDIIPLHITYTNQNLLQYWSIQATTILCTPLNCNSFYWQQLLLDTFTTRRIIWLCRYFKISFNFIMKLYICLILQQIPKLWAGLKLLLYRAKPTHQRRLILQYLWIIIHLLNSFSKYTKLVGYAIKIRGKINRAGSVRRKQLKFTHGQFAGYDIALKRLQEHQYLSTPAGVLGLTTIIAYKVINV